MDKIESAGVVPVALAAAGYLLAGAKGLDAARSGKIGDGKIFVSSIEDAIRIRNGDRGENAL